MRATETNRRRSALLGAGMVMVAGMMAQPADAAENMRFHGTLVAEPCVIQPGDEDIQLDFGTIVDKYLYLNTRTHSQTFALHLIECDLSLGNTVAITFTGTENAKLPGLLALDAGSLASGIGIGLEDSSGKALPLNRASDKFRLNAGNTTLTLQAYVQGEPEAIQTKTIGRGTFSAVATFTLEYE